MLKRGDLTKEVLAKLYLEENMTQSQIGEMYGIPKGSMPHIFKRYGVATRDTFKSKNISHGLLIKLYDNQGMSACDVGIELGVSDNCVRKYLRKYEIPIRSASSYKVKKLPIDEIVYKYTQEDVSCTKLSKLYNVSVAVISSRLKERGIKLRHGTDVKVSCETCGKLFSIKRKIYRKNQNQNPKCSFYCSDECLSVERKKAFSGKNNPNYVQKVKTKCANCGKKMEVNPCRITETGNVYCNNKCQHNGMSKHFSGELSHNWLGGIAAAPYCPVWLDKDFKEDIKIRDNYKCQNPDCRNNSELLCIHHIDYNKTNCHPDNLITLCFSCNARANSDREWHTSWYNALMYRSNKIINNLKNEV